MYTTSRPIVNCDNFITIDNNVHGFLHLNNAMHAFNNLPISGVRLVFVKNGFSPSRYQKIISCFHQMIGQVSRTKIWQQIE